MITKTTRYAGVDDDKKGEWSEFLLMIRLLTSHITSHYLLYRALGAYSLSVSLEIYELLGVFPTHCYLFVDRCDGGDWRALYFSLF